MFWSKKTNEHKIYEDFRVSSLFLFFAKCFCKLKLGSCIFPKFVSLKSPDLVSLFNLIQLASLHGTSKTKQCIHWISDGSNDFANDCF